jgi:hypothetical protein
MRLESALKTWIVENHRIVPQSCPSVISLIVRGTGIIVTLFVSQ